MKRGLLMLAVILASGSVEAVPLAAQADSSATAATVRVKQRSTWRGAKIGALVGAPAGALFGAFVVLLIEALCEYDCDSSAGEAILVTGGFAALGAVSGGAAGGIIGAAIPRWVETPGPAEGPSHFGMATLTPAYGRAARSGGGFGGRASFAFQTAHTSLGFEIAKYGRGTAARDVVTFCNTRPFPCADTTTVDASVFHSGLIARLGAGATRSIEPFASAGIGLYSWGGGGSFSPIQLLGYSAGAGVHVRSRTSRRGVVAEARWHSNLSNSGEPHQSYGFTTFALGGSLSW